MRRFLHEDVSHVPIDVLLEKYEEAVIMREFEVGIVQEAIVNAFKGE